jgi:hypothetical protein
MTQTLTTQFDWAKLSDSCMQTVAYFRGHVQARTTVSRITKVLVRIMHKARVVLNDDATHKKKIRMFLCAYMIMYYPNNLNVFEALNVRKRALFESCRPLLASFWAFVERQQDATREACSDFVVLLNTFIAAFRAWETPDKEKLTNRIKNSIRLLMQQRLLIAPENIALFVEYRKEIKTLIDKLAQITDEVRFFWLVAQMCFWLADIEATGHARRVPAGDGGRDVLEDVRVAQ